MDERLAAADAALKAGQGAEAIRQLAAALEANPEQSATVYRMLLLQLYRAGRYVNFAQAAIGAAAATFAFRLVAYKGWNWYVAVAAGLVIGIAIDPGGNRIELIQRP